MLKCTQQAGSCLELRSPDYRTPKPHKSPPQGWCGVRAPLSPRKELLVSPHFISKGTFQSSHVLTHGLLLVSPRSLSGEEIRFPPTSILFLLACIFLSKLLAASVLWTVAWHGQKRGTLPASGPGCGHDPGYQLQTLTGELGEPRGGWGWMGQKWAMYSLGLLQG